MNGSVRLSPISHTAIGVPRNKEIPVNSRRDHYDLGYAAALIIHVARTGYCGMFKTPTLRNVATRKVFLHNGQMKSQQVIRFYNTRDTNPELGIPRLKVSCRN